MDRLRYWALTVALAAIAVLWALSGTYTIVRGNEQTIWRLNTITGDLELCFPSERRIQCIVE